MDSLNRLPSIIAGAKHKHSNSVYEEPRSHLGLDLVKLKQKFTKYTEELNHIIPLESKKNRSADSKSTI
jgi:hypothetical protein